MEGRQKDVLSSLAACLPPEMSKGIVVEPRGGRQMVKVYDLDSDYHGEIVPAIPPCDDARPGDRVAFVLCLVGPPPKTLTALGVYQVSQLG